MTEPIDDLIERYLAGELNTDEVQQLNEALADDPLAVDALMSEAYLEVHLRETLNGSVLSAAIAEQVERSNQAVGRLLPSRCVTAALLLVAISGWAVAAYVFDELGEALTKINTLRNRVTKLELDSIKPSASSVKGDAPEIHSMRGWLMALPQNDDTATVGETLLVGTTAPLNQRIWTCPWGAAEFRYDSGVSISTERNTTVKINETDDVRRLTLERGIVHVTNLSETDNRPTEIKCGQVTVRLLHGQVAVQVNKQQTTVEAAVNQVEVLTEEDGVIRTFTVRGSEYLIISPGEKAKVTPGMLKLGLEQPNA